MSVDPKMERWIQSSLNVYFSGGQYKVFLEGEDINLANETKWVELRINGPRYRLRSQGEYRIDLEVNLACVSKDETNAYALSEMVGYFRNKCEADIPVNKHKDTNPAQFIACLQLRNDEPNPIDVVPWGQVSMGVDPIRVQMATIDAYFYMEI